MKISLVVIGKTEEHYLKEGIANYEKRLQHYVPFEIIEIAALKSTKNLSETQQKEKEGELLLKLIKPGDYLILLDEQGKSFSSIEFSATLQHYFNQGLKNIFFVVGGPYGFSESVYKKANGKIALSKMTFSHQMVRLFFIEQLYRAMTILKNEPYHHR